MLTESGDEDKLSIGLVKATVSSEIEQTIHKALHFKVLFASLFSYSVCKNVSAYRLGRSWYSTTLFSERLEGFRVLVQCCDLWLIK